MQTGAVVKVLALTPAPYAASANGQLTPISPLRKSESADAEGNTSKLLGRGG